MNAFAQQVMDVLMQKIPALAPPPGPGLGASAPLPTSTPQSVGSSFSDLIGVPLSGQPPNYVAVPSHQTAFGGPPPSVVQPVSCQLPPSAALPVSLPPSGQLPPLAAAPYLQQPRHVPLQPAPAVVQPPLQPALDLAQQQLLSLQRQVEQLRQAQGLSGGPRLQGAGHGQDLLSLQEQDLFQDQGLSTSQQVSTNQDSQVVSLDNLFSAHVKFKQYYAIDFCKLASFSYLNQLKSSNLNLSLYAYGSIKHLLAISDGTLPSASKEEIISRLSHILNVLEITCLGSNLSDFDSHS